MIHTSESLKKQDGDAAENRAARYLAHKQFEKEQRKHRDMDKFMAFTCGLAVCFMVHFLGAL